MLQTTLFDVQPALPGAQSDPVSLDAIRQLFRGRLWPSDVTVFTTHNWTRKAYAERPDPCATWAEALEMGRSYMVGDQVPLSRFLATHSSPLTDWQKLAYQWALQNPELMLILDKPGYSWQVYVRGEYVELNLPHQDAGGENTYITRDGRTKVHVNED